MVPREEEDARRDLRRLDEQSEKLFGTRSTDIGPDDPIERLGKRIARILSILIFIGLVFYLWRTYLVQ
jgi:hypothetical protein